MVALLVGNGRGPGAVRGIAPGVSVLFYGYNLCPNSSPDDDRLSAIGAGTTRAVEDGADIISISVSGKVQEDDAEAIADALAAGVVIVAATPNSSSEPAISAWPGGYNGVVSSAAFAQDGSLMEDYLTAGKPNLWPEVTVVAPGVDFPSVTWGEDADLGYVSGPSLTAPLVAGILAIVKKKYPDATGSQLVQSLILNTTIDDHELFRDTTGGYGYGPVSLRHMLREDPTLLPDENPLMDKNLGEPTTAQLEAAIAARAAPSPEATPATTASAATDADATTDPAPAAEAAGEVIGSPATWIVLAIVAVAVLAIALAIVVVVARRRRTRTPGSAGYGG